MMKWIVRLTGLGIAVWIGSISPACAQNQTPDVTPVLSEKGLPFRISIEQAGFSLPSGLQSYVAATFGGRWLMLAGRINGLHGFGSDSFPANQQNTTVFVVDPVQQTVFTRSLTAPGSGLTQAQVDLLSVTAAQSYQLVNTLYITGGYGVDTASGDFSTKDALTAIDVPALIQWVVDALPGDTAAQHIRQVHDPVFQVTGGEMRLGAGGVTLLMLGQNFVGDYVGSSNGTYTEQVSRFRIVDDGTSLSVVHRAPLPAAPDPDYRRRDLNVVPRIHDGNDAGWTALAGVFTPTTGMWTVPVDIATDGTPSMPDPMATDTFKQAMNGYATANFGTYSQAAGAMYTVLLGGISFGYFADGAFTTDAELPFINEVTTIRRGDDGNLSQHLMSGEYPVILSTGSNAGNPLLFGAGAHLFAADGLPVYANGVVDLDQLGTSPRIIGYIAGGIMSTLANTNTQSDSAASPYIFKVTLTPLPFTQAMPVPALLRWRLPVLVLLVGVLGVALRRKGTGNP